MVKHSEITNEITMVPWGLSPMPAIEVKLPMQWRAEALPFTDGALTAFMYGPSLMVGITPTKNDGDDFAKKRWKDHVASSASTGEPARMIVTEDKKNPVRPKDLDMMPFWKVYEEHYTIYFPVATPQEYADEKARVEREAAEEARRRANIIDEVAPGFQQSEVDHAFSASPETSSGDFYGRKWRDASGEKGFFSYVMKVDPVNETELACVWWGADRDRVFDICIDDTPIAEVRLDGSRGYEFFTGAYPLPRKLTEGKTKVKVTFRGKKGTWKVGGVFGISTVKRNSNP